MVDRILTIAQAKSHNSTKWKNKEYTWSEFIDKIKEVKRTNETVEEFKNLDSKKKGAIKNCIGGFVGGALKKEGLRNKENIENRCLLTLDIDHCTKPIDEYLKNINYAYCLYSTHSHREDYQRYRLIIPLDKDIPPEQFEAVSRMIASKIDIDIFDSTTHQPERLMYWNSCPIDGESVFRYKDAKFLKVNDVLSEYPFGWDDVESWPLGKAEKEKHKTNVKEQQDPLTKSGIIGAFCRTYTIQDVIEKYLSDVYELNSDNRATYTKGSTSNGVVIYEDKFSYSHHSTDPTSGICCNAFDLVRIHKFGHLDKELKKNIKENNKPSFKAMCEFAEKDKAVKKELILYTLNEAKGDFTEEDEEWLDKLITSKSGALISCLTNLELIMENDKNLSGKFRYNSFSNNYIRVGSLPWDSIEGDLRDRDITEARIYLERIYKLRVSSSTMYDLIYTVSDRNRISPPREYLKTLEWDGVERVDKLLIDYFGADDTSYTRAVTRKWLCGAIARIMIPGCKFDYMLVLAGNQGRGKSTFLHKLSKGWFTDSLKKVEGNQAIEKITGSWIVEIAELQALSKADSSDMKAFITATEDKARLAYAREVSTLKRQCVFVGTTNDEEFLKDVTGNRRYWVVNFLNKKGIKRWQDMSDSEINQIWAEAKYYYDKGETLYLNEELEEEADLIRLDHMISDNRQGLVEEYINTPITDNWDDMSPSDRYNYIHGSPFEGEKGSLKREFVSVIEVWRECFGYAESSLERKESIAISKILSNIPYLERTERRYLKPYGRQRGFKVLIH